MSVEVQHRLLMKLNVKDILSNRLDFSAAVRSEFKEEIPSNYHVLLPDRQRGSSSFGSPCTSNGDRLTSCHSSTYDSASSSPFSITKELTNVGSPLTPLSDISRSKSKSPIRAQSFLAEKSNSPIISVDSQKEEDTKSSDRTVISPASSSDGSVKKDGKKKKKKKKDKNGKSSKKSEERQDSSSSPLSCDTPDTITKNCSLTESPVLNRVSPIRLKKPEGGFSSSTAKAITFRIGSEVLSRAPLVSYDVSDNESSSGEKEEDEFSDDTEQLLKEINKDRRKVDVIIGPLKPGHESNVQKKETPKNGIREPVLEKRKAALPDGTPGGKRKRLLSERAEKEMAYPVMDKDNVSIWNWKDFRMIKGRNCGVGLYNNSNDCFLNAILQLITHTAPLARFIVEKHNTDNCYRPQGQCLCCSMRTQHFNRVFNAQNPFTASWIRPHLKRIFPSHIHGMQEDAHELLSLVLDALDPPPGHNKNSGAPSGILPKSSTPIEQIFGGTLRNQITCTSCRTPYINYERIRELNLAIRKMEDGEPIRISSLMDIYFRDENVSSFDCKKCGRKTIANRVTRILRPPAVLLVQLKRFNAFGGKIRLPVTADMGVDLMRFLFDGNSSTSSAKYVLTSVVEHLGAGVDHGHYISYVRGYDAQKWFLFDDEQISNISANKVEDSNPYLLLYSRQTDIPAFPKSPETSRSLSVGNKQNSFSKINHSPFNRNGASYGSSNGFNKKYSNGGTPYNMHKWKPGLI